MMEDEDLDECDEDGVIYDSKERDPKYKERIRKADKEADEELKRRGIKEGLGYCCSFWSEKKKILKEKYNLEWKSPQELNPGVLFD